MLSKVLPLLTLAAAVASETSPLFLFSSTAQLPFHSQDHKPNPLANDIAQSLYRSLATCPTTHYAVIVEPQTLTYTNSNSNTNNNPTTPNKATPLYLPGSRNAATTFLTTNLHGSLNTNHILNTILMDCLSHKVLHVHELDTSNPSLPNLDASLIRENIIYAVLPRLEPMRRDDYARVMKSRRGYVERIVEKYFDDEDYTLIYLREREVVVEEGFGERPVVEEKKKGEKEVPLLENDELRRV